MKKRPILKKECIVELSPFFIFAYNDEDEILDFMFEMLNEMENKPIFEKFFRLLVEMYDIEDIVQHSKDIERR